MGAYQALDLTISEALNQRSPDFPGVVICTASDSIGTLLQLIKKRRVHRLVVVEGDEEEKRGGRKGRLLGIISLADVLQYITGEKSVNKGERVPPAPTPEPPAPESPPVEEPAAAEPAPPPEIVEPPPPIPEETSAEAVAAEPEPAAEPEAEAEPAPEPETA